MTVVISAAYVLPDFATGQIDAEEAGSKMLCSVLIGAGVSFVVKTALTWCPKAAFYLASKGFPMMATCCRNALPLVGCAVALLTAAWNIRYACKDDAQPWGSREAWASSFEAIAAVAATVAVLALECSGPVGRGIFIAGLVGGFCIRKAEFCLSVGGWFIRKAEFCLSVGGWATAKISEHRA